MDATTIIRARRTLHRIEALYAKRPTDRNADRVAYARWLCDVNGVL